MPAGHEGDRRYLGGQLSRSESMSVANSSARALKPRARILRTLGEELISSETVAVIELVKNSYDADASHILVNFDEKGGLTISDDGHGMTFEVVERAWMEPATNYKKKAKNSPFLGRRLLGEKGVGRFAAARLARELDLITRAAASDREVHAYFDWTQFDDEELYLDDVLILAEERIPSEIVVGRYMPHKGQPFPGLPRDGSHGTILRMSGLKKEWGPQELRDLQRGLSRLISPFFSENEFRIYLRLPGEVNENPQQIEAPEIIRYPHYTLAASVAADGEFKLVVELHATGRVTSESGKLIFSEGNREVMAAAESSDESRNLECGPFELHLRVWDRDQLDNLEQKIGTGLRSIRRDLDSVAGISVYRDGFRVLPYGEPGNDWLNLDIRRVQNPTLRLSNNQITGYVKIGLDQNPLLRDQSNREGLDNNRAYADLKAAIRYLLSRLERERASERKAEKTDERGRHPNLFRAPPVDALRERIEATGGDKQALQLLEDTTKAWESQIVRIREVVSRYHSLATIGQLVDKVVHDGRQPLSTIQGQAALARDYIKNRLKKLDEDSPCFEALNKVGMRLAQVREAADLIDLLLKRIEPLGGRRKGRPSKVYINEIIKSSFEHFSHEIDSLGIIVSLPQADDLISVDPLELQEVFINLISNSVHWLRVVPKGRRSIVVLCNRIAPGELEIIFADSGPGIPVPDRNAIFDPYFSTKPDGTGLGLAIAGEIIRDYYDGDLELLDSGPLSGAVFRIVLRKRVG